MNCLFDLMNWHKTKPQYICYVRIPVINTTVTDSRKREIVRQYIAESDKQILQLKEGQAERAQ